MVEYGYKQADVWMKKTLKKQDGFTLLELIVVMIAVVILVAVVMYFYNAK